MVMREPGLKPSLEPSSQELDKVRGGMKNKLDTSCYISEDGRPTGTIEPGPEKEGAKLTVRFSGL